MAAAHNSLAGLQGGGGTERYHLTAAERGAVQAMVGAAYVVAAGANPDGQCRQWSDGKIEQWGVYLVGDMASNSNASITIPLPIAYPDESFQSLMSIEMTTGNQISVYRAGGDPDPSRIAININNTGIAATVVKVHWRTISV
ncbi:hypothetical protein [Pseudomonas sp. NPDC086251]|uniref:gp53-like domain-containing protein n=1 Tax=Pseudomonas sp. NPDC086251 TaxID=3364431 RepID=UPI00383498BD